MIKLPPDHIQKIIFDSISVTDDGVAIYDEKDCLIYCNNNIEKLFGITPERALYKTFSWLIKNCFKSASGINIESDNIKQWLAKAVRKRRSCPYRTFETDTKDGHWYLITEQIVNDSYLYVYSTDITEQKQNEQALECLSKQLHQLASTDALTLVNNRRNFYELAEIEFNRSQRSEQLMALMVIDLDHFKQINDNFGHAAGDTVLKSFADNITGHLRAYDIFGRIGGDEFAILLPATDDEEAFTIAERIRKSVETMTIPFQGELLKITISIGLASYFSANQSIDEVIHNADKFLYQAKFEGRNKICKIATPPL